MNKETLITPKFIWFVDGPSANKSCEIDGRKYPEIVNACTPKKNVDPEYYNSTDSLPKHNIEFEETIYYHIGKGNYSIRRL